MLCYFCNNQFEPTENYYVVCPDCVTTHSCNACGILFLPCDVPGCNNKHSRRYEETSLLCVRCGEGLLNASVKLSKTEYNKSYYQKHKVVTLYEINCKECNIKFITSNSKKQYCDLKCQRKHNDIIYRTKKFFTKKEVRDKWQRLLNTE